MKNLGISLLALFIVSIGSISAAPLLKSSDLTSISCDGDKCCKKKKKKKCKDKDKEACKGKEKATEEEAK